MSLIKSILSDPGPFILLMVVNVFATAILIAAFKYSKDLEKFRSTLTTGTIVKVKNQYGTFRARVVNRGNGLLLTVKDIDTKEIKFSELKNIYQP